MTTKEAAVYLRRSVDAIHTLVSRRHYIFSDFRWSLDITQVNIETGEFSGKISYLENSVSINGVLYTGGRQGVFRVGQADAPGVSSLSLQKGELNLSCTSGYIKFENHDFNDFIWKD